MASCEHGEVGLCFRVVFVERHQYPDPLNPLVLLRTDSGHAAAPSPAMTSGDAGACDAPGVRPARPSSATVIAASVSVINASTTRGLGTDGCQSSSLGEGDLRAACASPRTTRCRFVSCYSVSIGSHAKDRLRRRPAVALR
jgi:hypothetical protein